MPQELHFEPFVHLAGLTHDDALIAWGGFWFEAPADAEGPWRVIGDPELASRGLSDGNGSIGAESSPYGHAVVEVYEASGDRVVARASTAERNHAWVRGLRPDTEHRYRITVDGETWADGPTRACEVDGGGRFRLVRGRPYDNRFRTFPAPDARCPVTLAVMGDYGVGILASQGRGARQQRVARALEGTVTHHGVRVVVTTGDNIYLGDEDTAAGSGQHDDDWYFSFYEPYRHVINQVPFCPTIGNHDASDTEQSDDRDQVADNLFTDLRFASQAEIGRASVDPGLFYRFDVGGDVELVCIDTTLASELEHRQYFQSPHHREFLEGAFPAHDHSPGEPHPRWRIPFSHHPPYCAGPNHPNLEPMVDELVPLFERSGVRLVLAGHEHNLQLSRRKGITYVVTGSAGKVRDEPPTRFSEAHTVAWAAGEHLLLVHIDGAEATLHPVRDVDDDGSLRLLELQQPDGTPFDLPVLIHTDLRPPEPPRRWEPAGDEATG